MISIFVMPYTGYLLYRAEKDLVKQTFNQNVLVKDYSIICLIFGALGLGVVPMFIIQKQLNKLIEDHE